ncbi:MAG: MBL fold metallo-hydrolase [Moorea sp. SIO3C2]|nr:MBL fold metallo-hydrolase [Moorena sp. SIO3C2]
MKRRQLMRYVSAGVLTTLSTGLASGLSSYQAQPSRNVLTVKWLGHTCFLFTGGGVRVLVNPFQTIGCTARYNSPKVEADLVLISSLLLDEGAAEGIPGSPRLLFEPGIFQVNGLKFEGISIPHDRVGGRRFGNNVAWKWTQNGINILHMGGAAAPLDIEQKILIGRPDLALIPVGGGPKAYNPQEAKQAFDFLKAKIMIPTHFRTKAADAEQCDILPVEEFLTLMKDTPIRRAKNDTIRISSGDLSQDGSVIQLMSYNYNF